MDAKGNIAVLLQQKGVGIMLAGNMGNGALSMLNSHGIDVYRGCSGNVTQLIQSFFQNKYMTQEKVVIHQNMIIHATTTELTCDNCRNIIVGREESYFSF